MVGFKIALEQSVHSDWPSTSPGRLELTRGLVAIIGNSGSGKSTLLRMLESAVAARRMREPHWENALKSRWEISEGLYFGSAQGITVTPQENTLIYPSLRTRENIEHYLRSLPWDGARCPSVLRVDGKNAPSTVRKRAAEALNRVGLSHCENMLATSLSGGQKRRLLLAMDLALGPEVLVADEPLSQLDSSSASQIFKVLQEYAQTNLVLFTVHQPLDEWVRRCREVWIVEAPTRVVSAVSGTTFVTAGRGLADILGADTDNPAAHTILRALGDEKKSSGSSGSSGVQVLQFLQQTQQRFLHSPWSYEVIAQHELLRPPSKVPFDDLDSTELNSYVRAPSSTQRFLHCVAHEIRSEFISNLKNPVYLLMLLLFIGVTLLTNFVGSANQMPFSIPSAANALLISSLFIGTTSGVRVWLGAGADRIRQLRLRGLKFSHILISKAAPAIFELLTIALLAFLGIVIMKFRPGAEVLGWPDTFSNLSWFFGLPSIVLLVVYVGFVGWLQGITISIFIALYRQRSIVTYQKNIGNVMSQKPKRQMMLGDPVAQAYSLAVLMIVGQIGLSGAFGKITKTFHHLDDIVQVDGLVTSTFDILGSFSPLRWGYNAAIVSEWRQSRCRIHNAIPRNPTEDECVGDRLNLGDLKFPQECIAGLPSEDRLYLSRITDDAWKKLGEGSCADGSEEPLARGEYYPQYMQEEIAIYYQTAGQSADQLSRIQNKIRMLGLRRSPFPIEVVSQSFSAERWAELNHIRQVGATPRKFRCAQRRANIKYEQALAEELVGKGMLRPKIVDVEWCWRYCPDVRESNKTGVYMLAFCPAPGQSDPFSGETMKDLNVPIVSLFNVQQKYPCTDEAHSVFADPDELAHRLDFMCDKQRLTGQEWTLFYWMTGIAAFWFMIAIHRTLTWSKRLQHGG